MYFLERKGSETPHDTHFPQRGAFSGAARYMVSPYRVSKIISPYIQSGGGAITLNVDSTSLVGGYIGICFLPGACVNI